MTHDPARDDLPAALRMQLRGLRVDAPPARDLWPDIAARLSEAPAATALPPRRMPLLPAFATAAALALAVGAAWQMRPDGPAEAPTLAVDATAADAGSTLFLLEAQALTREYEGALRELAPTAPPAAEHEALRQLDASAADVRQALAQDPDARFLLQRLQRVYAQRLSLTQRLARA